MPSRKTKRTFSFDNSTLESRNLLTIATPGIAQISRMMHHGNPVQPPKIHHGGHEISAAAQRTSSGTMTGKLQISQDKLLVGQTSGTFPVVTTTAKGVKYTTTPVKGMPVTLSMSTTSFAATLVPTNRKGNSIPLDITLTNKQTTSQGYKIIGNYKTASGYQGATALNGTVEINIILKARTLQMKFTQAPLAT